MIGAKLRIIHENYKKTEKKIPKVWYYSKKVVPLPSSNVSINSSNNFKLIRIMAYVIGEDCISCGTCAGECPVEAISEGAERLMLMLAQSAAHAQVFVLLRLSAFPKHIGHTKE